MLIFILKPFLIVSYCSLMRCFLLATNFPKCNKIRTNKKTRAFIQILCEFVFHVGLRLIYQYLQALKTPKATCMWDAVTGYRRSRVCVCVCVRARVRVCSFNQKKDGQTNRVASTNRSTNYAIISEF